MAQDTIDRLAEGLTIKIEDAVNKMPRLAECEVVTASPLTIKKQGEEDSTAYSAKAESGVSYIQGDKVVVLENNEVSHVLHKYA